MGKLKRHFHDEITYGQSEINDYPKEVILSQDYRVHLKVLISLALLNYGNQEFYDNHYPNMTCFYMSEDTVKKLNEIRDVLDKL